MNLLLDEQLDTNDGSVIAALNAFGSQTSLRFRSLRTEKRGLSDPEVVWYSKREDMDALVSFNHKDFGKKKALYRDLLAAGVSVVVLRPPPKIAFTPAQQASLIFKHAKCIESRLADSRLVGPILLRLTATDCRQRTLREIEAEFEEGPRKLP